MSATRDKYIPELVSQRLIEPLTFCRGASTVMAWAGATLGDYVTKPNGRPWGPAQYKNLLTKMRKQADDPNIAGWDPSYNQSDIPAFLKAMGVSAPASEFIVNGTFEKLLTLLGPTGRQHFVTLAGNVGKTPAGSALRKFVNPVGHKIILIDYDPPNNRIRFIDPMTPMGTAAYARWAPVNHFKQFASAFKSGGKYVYEKWPVGYYSNQAIAVRKQSALVVSLQTKNAELTKGWQEADKELDDTLTALNELNKKYQELLASGSQPIERDKIRELLVTADKRIANLKSDLTSIGSLL